MLCRQWRFAQRDMSTSQKFMNTIVVSFLRHDIDTDYYKPYRASSLSVIPDVSNSQDVIYPWTVSPAIALFLSLFAYF
jgi:hypothetical protein